MTPSTSGHGTGGTVLEVEVGARVVVVVVVVVVVASIVVDDGGLVVDVGFVVLVDGLDDVDAVSAPVDGIPQAPSTTTRISAPADRLRGRLSISTRSLTGREPFGRVDECRHDRVELCARRCAECKEELTVGITDLQHVPGVR
jgi:hypothetical protein